MPATVKTLLPLTLAPVASVSTESPAATFSILDAVAANTTVASVVSAGTRAGQQVKYRASLTLPSGAGATSVRLVLFWRDSTGNQIGAALTTTAVTLSATAQVPEIVGTAPSGAVSVHTGVRVAATGATRKVAVAGAVLESYADGEIIAAQLERNYKRTDVDLLNTAAAQINAGTPGLLAGQLVYLCDTLAAAIALDAVYCTTPAAQPVTGGDLDGLLHRAVGKGRLAAERALAGRPSKWLLTVDIREVLA